MDDTWAWVYLGVQALQTLQTIALRREVRRTATSLRPPPPSPEGLQLPFAQPTAPVWRSWLPGREREQQRPPEQRDTPQLRRPRS